MNRRHSPIIVVLSSNTTAAKCCDELVRTQFCPLSVNLRHLWGRFFRHLWCRSRRCIWGSRHDLHIFFRKGSKTTCLIQRTVQFAYKSDGSWRKFRFYEISEIRSKTTSSFLLPALQCSNTIRHFVHTTSSSSYCLGAGNQKKVV